MLIITICIGTALANFVYGNKMAVEQTAVFMINGTRVLEDVY